MLNLLIARNMAIGILGRERRRRPPPHIAIEDAVKIGIIG